MEHSWQNDVDLPKSVTKPLRSFLEAATDAVGDKLLAILLYGSAAKGEFRTKTSDVNVLLAFKDVDLETLDALSPIVKSARLSMPLSTFLLTEKDLERSTDVFPIKFLDIQAHHKVLYGDDVFADLEIEQDHIRLRCEQEFKNLSIRLRAFYLQRLQRAERIEQTLSNSFSSFLLATDTLLYLKTGEHAVTRAKIIEQAGKELDLDSETLQTLHSLKRGEYEGDLTELKGLYSRFMQLVDQAADLADRME